MANQQCGSKNKGFHLTRLAAMLPLAIVASGCGGGVPAEVSSLISNDGSALFADVSVRVDMPFRIAVSYTHLTLPTKA